MSGFSTTDVTASATRMAQSLGAVSPKSQTTGTTSTGSTSDAAASTQSEGISSSDFLTLLVTEMKNQDPTQPTDPNAYIQQLVGVNSLQQLISINQELGGASSGTATATGSNRVSSVSST